MCYNYPLSSNFYNNIFCQTPYQILYQAPFYQKPVQYNFYQSPFYQYFFQPATQVVFWHDYYPPNAHYYYSPNINNWQCRLRTEKLYPVFVSQNQERDFGSQRGIEAFQKATFDDSARKASLRKCQEENIRKSFIEALITEFIEEKAKGDAEEEG